MGNLKCKVCGSDDIFKKDEIYECRICGSQDIFDTDEISVNPQKGLSHQNAVHF